MNLKLKRIAKSTVSLSRYPGGPTVEVTLDRLGPLYQVKVDGAMSWHLSYPTAKAEFQRQVLILEESVRGD